MPHHFVEKAAVDSKAGDSCSFSKTVTEAEVSEFA